MSNSQQHAVSGGEQPTVEGLGVTSQEEEIFHALREALQPFRKQKAAVARVLKARADELIGLLVSDSTPPKPVNELALGEDRND